MIFFSVLGKRAHSLSKIWRSLSPLPPICVLIPKNLDIYRFAFVPRRKTTSVSRNSRLASQVNSDFVPSVELIAAL